MLFQNQDSIQVLIDILVVFSLVVIISTLFFSLRKYSREQAEIAETLQNGEPAQAKILKLIDTGSSVNDSPKVILQLEIYPPEGIAYPAEIKFYVPRLNVAQVQPGNMIAVKINRQDKTKIAVDFA